MGEKYFSVPMSLSTPGKQKSHMIQEKWERVYLFVEVKTVLYVKKANIRPPVPYILPVWPL